MWRIYGSWRRSGNPSRLRGWQNDVLTNPRLRLSLLLCSCESFHIFVFCPGWNFSFVTGRELETRLSLNSLRALGLSQATESIFYFFTPSVCHTDICLSTWEEQDAASEQAPGILQRKGCQVQTQKQTWCCASNQSMNGVKTEQMCRQKGIAIVTDCHICH